MNESQKEKESHERRLEACHAERKEGKKNVYEVYHTEDVRGG